jgi:hypothetical protein
VILDCMEWKTEKQNSLDSFFNWGNIINRCTVG